MSLKNCLLFDLARNIYDKYPYGYNKTDTPGIVRNILNNIFDANLQLIEQLDKSLIIHRVSLSGKLFFNTVYLPASIRNNQSNTPQTEITNFISLGIEIAGLNLSNSIIQSSLICGSKESTLQSQGISLDSSELADVVFAYNNLNGISCRETIFRDVLIRNCSIEFGVFYNYAISNSLTICYDTDEDGKTCLNNCVFSCDSKQKQPKHEFVLSNILLKECLFLGYFEPTHLYGVVFDSCNFGSNKQSEKCTILGKTPEKEQAINKWVFNNTSFVSCSVQNMHDSIVVSNAPRIDYLELIECNIPELIIDVSSLEKDATIKIENSTINNLEINAKVLKYNVAKPILILHESNSNRNSIFYNPKLNSININGDLLHLSVVIDNKTQGSFKNCNISCEKLDSKFIHCKGTFDLTGTHFLGKPQKHMRLEKVDFSKCILNETDFSYCDLIECVFPELNTNPTSTKHNNTKRAWFRNCNISNKKIDNADLSYIEICKNSSVKITKISDSSFAFSSIHPQLYSTTWQRCDFEEFHFPEKISGDEKDTIAIEKCNFVFCTNLHFSNTSISDSEFSTTENDTGDENNKILHNITLSGELLFRKSIFQNQSVITNEASVRFEKDCEVTNTKFNNPFQDAKASKIMFEETTLSNCSFSFITFDNNAFNNSIMSDNDNGVNTLSDCKFSDTSKPFRSMNIQSLSIINPKFKDDQEIQFLESIFNNQITIEGTESNPDNADKIKLQLQDCFDNFTTDNTQFFIKSSNTKNTAIQIKLSGKYYCQAKFTSSEQSVNIGGVIQNTMSYQDWCDDFPLYNRFSGKILMNIWHSKSDLLYYFGHELKGSIKGHITLSKYITENKDKILGNIRKVINFTHLRFILSGETYRKLVESMEQLKDNIKSGKYTKEHYNSETVETIMTILTTSRLDTSGKKSFSIDKWLFSKFKNTENKYLITNIGKDETKKYGIKKLYADFYSLESIIGIHIQQVQDHANSKHHIGVFQEKSYVSICLGDCGPGFNEENIILDFLNKSKIPKRLTQFAQSWIPPSEEPEKCLGFTTIYKNSRVFYIYRDGKWEQIHNNFLNDFKSLALIGTYYNIPIPVLIDQTEGW